MEAIDSSKILESPSNNTWNTTQYTLISALSFYIYFLFTDRDLCGFRIMLGASLQNVMTYSKISAEDVKLLASFYRLKKYLMVVDIEGKRIFVTFLQGETAVDVIQAYFHAVLLGIAICIIRNHPLVRNKALCSESVCFIECLQLLLLSKFFHRRC